MMRRTLWALGVIVLLVIPLTTKAQENYLDVETVRVKPEKAAEFNAITKKITDANRRFHGDHWLTLETVYGDNNTFLFVSPRQDYAAIDKGNDAYTNALEKAFGKNAAEKISNDENSCLASMRTELRRRRMDLSRKAPADAAAFAKLIGESRVVRTLAVRVRSGHAADFEALLKEVQEAGEKVADTQPLFVSQGVEGGRGATYYISALRSSLGGFDNNPTLQVILGEEGYKKFLQRSAEFVEGTESALYRFSPELSNPPDEIAAASAEFWRPKAAPVAAKPKTTNASQAGGKPAAEKPKP